MRVLQNLEEPAPCGLIEPLDPVLFIRSKLGNNTLQVQKQHKLRPALAKSLRKHKLITRLPPQLGCPGRKIRSQQRQQRPMQTKCSVIRRWRVSKGGASQSKCVAFESAKKIRKAEVLTKPVIVPHHASCSDDPENCVEQASEHRKTTRPFLKRLARGGFETRTLPLKGRPSSVIRESKISQVGREQGIECSHRPTLSPLLSHASCCWVPDPRHPSCS